MDKEQIYMYNRQEVKIHHEIEGLPDYVVVLGADGYGEWVVARKTDLVKLEDSYEFKRAQERANKLRLVTAKAEENFEKITEKVIKAACSTLKTRMKMNILFKDGMNTDGWAVIVANELDKLVREQASEVIENEK